MPDEILGWTGSRVQLRRECQRLYPALRPQVYPVVDETPIGIWIAGEGLGDPFLTPGRCFVFREHFERVEGE